MKKFFLLFLALSLVFSSVPVLCANTVTVEINGQVVECENALGEAVYPILKDGTTYLPVRAVATYLDLDIAWDDKTKTVFINGVTDSEKSEAVNIFINGEKFIAKDASGKIVNPILEEGTTYLPIRAIGEALGMKVLWIDETKTASLTSEKKAVEIKEGTTYAFINKANKKAISLTDEGLVLESFNNYTNQGFTLSKSDTEGYWYITASNDKNFDVNANSKNPGAKIITYNKGTAENQKFCLENTEGGFVIYALSSLLPIEDSAGVVKQNERRESLVQRWDVVEFTPTEKADEKVYYTISIDDLSLYSTDSLAYGYIKDNPDALCWALTPDEYGEYTITNKNTNKSLDVANNSKASGDPVIVYDTSNDPNQKWTLEKNDDGTYLIKSVHSSLYLSIFSDGSVVQAELNKSYKQDWILNPVK